jgi:hypothetical protein
MLIRAIVSGLGDLIGSSRMGLLGADDVKGRDVRFRGSGRLKGAGSLGVAVTGSAGRRKFDMGTSLSVSRSRGHGYSLSLAGNSHQPSRVDYGEIGAQRFGIVTSDPARVGAAIGSCADKVGRIEAHGGVLLRANLGEA